MEWTITKICEDCFEGYNHITGEVIIGKTRAIVGERVQAANIDSRNQLTTRKELAS